MRRSSLLGLLGLLLLATGCDPVARGDAAWDDGRVEDAVTAWTEAEELDTAHRGRLARALVRLGRLDAAAETLDDLPVGQRTAEGHLASGLLLLHLGDLSEATAAFAAGIAVEPMPELLVNQCTALGQLGKLSARAACQDAIEADPQDPRPYLGLAAASVDDLPDAARESLGIAIARAGPAGSPLRQDLAPWIGELWRALGEHGAACTWSLEGGATDLDTAQSCLAGGQVASAIPLLEQLVDGDQPIVPLRLLFQLALDRAEQAQAGPERVKALASADRWLQRLQPLMVDSRDPGWLNDLGRKAWLEDHAPQAEAHWAQAVAIAPSQAAPRLNLAKALVRRGRSPEASDLLLAAAAAGTQGPGLHAVQLALAKIELQAGQADSARRRLEGVHRACTSTGQPACAARAALSLARIEAQDGETELALQHLTQALSFGGPGLRPDIARDPAFASLAQDLRFRQLTSSD